VDEFETYNGGLLSECKVTLVPVQSGSGDPSPDNVRPISGHTQVKVGDDGKNRLPLVLADIKALNTSGTWNGNVYTINGGTITIDTDVDGNAIDIKANGTFTARTILNITMPTNNYHPTSGSYIINKSYQNASTAIIIDAYNNNTWVQTLARSSSVDDVQFTLDYSGYDRLSIYLEILNGTSANNIILKPMIRLASDTDPTYVPYKGYQVTVNLGGTYYGGTVDLVSGVFTVISTMDEYTWGDGTNATSRGNNITSKKFALSQMALNKEQSNKGDFANVTKNQKYNTTGTLHFFIDSDSSAVMFLPTDTDNSQSIQICYALATPITIQLTPQQVKALVGENHLSAPLDGQEITESKYKQMFTFDDVIAYIQSLS